MSDDKKKLVNLSGLKAVAKGLDQKATEKVQTAFNSLDSEIKAVSAKLGGREFVFLTMADYKILSEQDKNNTSKYYAITDTEKISHDHENKEYLDNIENTIQNLDSAIKNKVDANHAHDDKYCPISRIEQSENNIESLGQQISGFDTTIAAIPETVKSTVLNELLGGKRHVYLLGDAYDALTEAEKSDETVVYNIIDAESTEHEHENLDTLNGIQPITFKIGNAIKNLDYRTPVEISLDEIGASKSDHNHDDMYYTESEINTMLEDLSSSYNDDYVEMLSEIEGKAEKDHTHSMAEISETFAEEDISPVGGKLTLTDNRLQYARDVATNTEIVFPAVASYTELHVFFESTENLNLVFPDNCKWRIDANIEAGSAYELIAKYNPKAGIWLVNILVYS